MLGITFADLQKLRRQGYHFIENNESSKALLVKGRSKVVAKFVVDESLLIVKVAGETLRRVSAVNIVAMESSKWDIRFELFYPNADTCNEPIWGYLSTEGKMVIV